MLQMFMPSGLQQAGSLLYVKAQLSASLLIFQLFMLSACQQAGTRLYIL
jgi:hypothetical protein